MPATVLGFETTTSFRTYRLWRGQIRKLPVVTRKEHCDSGVLGERALGIVLVLSGCCNNIPQPGRLTDCRNVLLTVLEAGSQISGPAWSGASPLSGPRFLLVSSYHIRM